MKSRFSTADISAVVKELKRFLGMRVYNIYDVDNKTYLIRLSRPDEKAVLLLESGIRLHSTEFDWPKNPAPSGFSMKMRKHLKGRRLEVVNQLGVDRIVDLQFGSGEAAYHVVLELYDRGNIVLTDFEYTILNILRPRTDNSQDVRFAVRETYPISSAKQHETPDAERLQQIISSGKEGDPLKKFLIPHLDYGPALIDHCLIQAGFSENVKIGKGFSASEDMPKLMVAIEEAERLLTKLNTENCKGYIIQRKDKRPNPKEGEAGELLTYEEFHPLLLKQHENKSYVEFPSFDRAADEFFSKLESQRLDVKMLQQEKNALKKLENVKKDHEKRIQYLQKEQETDIERGQLIEMNLALVDQAILIVRSALANQIDWTEIWNLVKEAQLTEDPVACAIKSLKLDTNHITLFLKDPYDGCGEEEDGEYEPLKPLKIDIDLALSAYANSRKFFEKKRQAAKKEQKTVDASTKAFKSAEKKTKQTLKEVATIASINKTRKTYWFEKFLWFITSENYLVIGGRDQQQNELIVKRYLRPGDLYVHADLHGASSCIIKNTTGQPVPPKTLNEAGTMAICNSAAWDAKVVTSAWYVHHDQVSKTAPSGEYLTTGSFMIRGKKNYLPPSYLIYGFAFLFKLEEGSVFRHKGERKVRTLDDDEMSNADSFVTESDITMETNSADEESDSDEDSADECKKSENTESGNEKNTEMDAEHLKSEEEDFERIDVKVEDVKNSANLESKEEESQFPDTSISLQHVKGDKYELQRGISTTSSVSETGSGVIYLGDDQPVIFGERGSGKGSKLSAKKRRELRKARKGQQPQSQKDEDEEEDKISWLNSDASEEKSEPQDKETSSNTPANQQQLQQSQPPAKRGQKSKLKKIKEKYKDQDEEERQLRMEILASAGSQKEKKKKGKKGKEVQHFAQGRGGKQPGSRPQSGRPQGPQNPNKEVFSVASQISDIALEADTATTHSDQIKKQDKSAKDSKVEDAGSDEEKPEDENTQQTDDIQILDSLTGTPVGEDEILYAIPVCAPYSCLVNYKYKVKLMPGNTKRGKATKTAVNMFLHDRSASPREKDLLRILKDVDMSRNIPGKVKVAAPNLHKKRK